MLSILNRSIDIGSEKAPEISNLAGTSDSFFQLNAGISTVAPKRSDFKVKVVADPFFISSVKSPNVFPVRAFFGIGIFKFFKEESETSSCTTAWLGRSGFPNGWVQLPENGILDIVPSP